MPLILSGNVASATAGVYEVANSCRFNDDDSAYMHKTFGAGGATKKWTFSTWYKRGNITLSAPQNLFGGEDGGSRYTDIMVGTPIGAGDFLWWKQDTGTAAELKTTQVLRDPAAWYHIVFAYDSAQATASDRNKMYLNGVRITDFATETNVAQDVDSYVCSDGDKAFVGVYDSGSKFLDGYMAETILIDNQALTPTSFGEFNEDSPTIWQPIDISGLSVGTQGFYLDYEDSSNLGNDVSGGTDFTEVNLAAADQATDTPTNNFCVVNNLDNYYGGATFAEGNCKVTTGASNQTFNLGTIGLSTGKWFWEAYLTTAGGEEAIGIGALASTGTSDYGGKTAYSYSFKGNNGDIRNNDSNSDYGDAYAQDVVIGVALNLDDNEIKFYKDGTVENSGTAHSITAAASTPTGLYFPMFGDVDTDSVVWSVNFGGSPASTVSSGNADANGYGSFEYAVPSGFYSICTKNLAEYG